MLVCCWSFTDDLGDCLGTGGDALLVWKGVRLKAELPRWLSGKESVCQHRTLHSIPGSGRSPREGNSSPLQYSCLENPIYRGAQQATVHGVTEESVTTSYDLVTRQPRLFQWW